MTNNEILRRLNKLDLKQASDYDIQDLLAYMIENGVLPAIQVKLPAYTVITRSRAGENYYTKEALSYKPVDECKTYQRATRPGETIFYGVIADKKYQLEAARAITMMECSELMRKGLHTKGVESHVVGQWLTKRELVLWGLFSDQTFQDCSKNALVQQCKNSFEEIISKMPNKTESLAFSRFIAKQFFQIVKNGKEWKYKISSNLVSIIRKLPNYNFDGIIYPSGRSKGQYGVNVAIFPDAADKVLVFNKKAKQVLYKYKKNVFVRIEGYAESVDADYSVTKKLVDEEILAALNIQSLAQIYS